MDEPQPEVARLLTRMVDAAGRFDPPPLDQLTGRHLRRSRTRATVAVLASAATIAALAGGLAISTQRGLPTAKPPAAHTSSTTSAPGVPVSALLDYRWRPLPAAPIEPREYAASVWTGRQLILWGGVGADSALYADGAAYEPATRTWSMLPTGPLTNRAHASAVWVDGQLLIWGGQQHDGEHAVDGARYDPATRGWQSMAAAPVTSIGWGELVAVGDKAVLLTSPVDPASRVLHADLYDPRHNTWHTLPDLTTPNDHDFSRAAALSIDSAVVVWRAWQKSVTTSTAGNAVEIETTSNVDTFALNTQSWTWNESSARPDPGRMADQPIWTGRAVLIPGERSSCICRGKYESALPSVEVDPRTGRRTVIPLGPAGSADSVYAWSGAALLGLNLRGSGLSVWDRETDVWTPLPQVDDAFRASFVDGTAIWAGDRLLVWGLTSPRGKTSPNAGLEFAPANP